MWRSIIDTGQWRGEIINGQQRRFGHPELVAINTVYNEYGEPASYVAIYTDISQIKESQGQLAPMALSRSADQPAQSHPCSANAFTRSSATRAAMAAWRSIFVDLVTSKRQRQSRPFYGDRLLIEWPVLSSAAPRGYGREGSAATGSRSDRGSHVTAPADIGHRKDYRAFDREFVLGDSTIRVTRAWASVFRRTTAPMPKP